jgi:enoyl-CoA hydratase
LRQIVLLRDAADLRAAVITGTLKCFAAGADLVEVGGLTAIEATRFAGLGQSLMQTIEECDKPVIAAIRGYCLGGGLDLALACHAAWRPMTPCSHTLARGWAS